ncbi:MAG: 50S ribosomal protein L31, partial [Hyphomicrobiales bacterium]|nr:50S ribosomal protein L31 [Hyphomicrobiales bacterium]
MKKEIHPDYHPVVFVDGAANYELISRSTMRSKETREIDGRHYVLELPIHADLAL